LSDVYQDMLRIYDQKKDTRSIQGVVGRIRPREKQLNAHTAGGMTALMFAARENDMESVKILTEAGADVNSVLQDGTTALLMAIFNTNFEVADYLLSKGADPNLADKDGKAPLFAAVEMRNWYGTDTPGPAINREDALGTIKVLLDHGADVNARLTGRPPYRGGANRMWLTLPGATPFYRAASSDDITLLRLLLAYGADPTITASDGSTPLMVATGAGYIPGNTYLAPENEALEAVRLCLQVNDVNAVNSAGLTALHAAAFRGWNPVVEALVKNGAKIDAKDKEGRTPLVWADGLYRGGGIAPVWHVDTVALLNKLAN
jgi:ankyrin repeat protein